MKIKIFDNIHWQTIPEVEGMVDLDITEQELYQVGITKQFDIEHEYKLIDYLNPQIEIDNLKNWFSTYYTEHEQKYRRLYSLNKLCDDGTMPKDALKQLYTEAETKRQRIQILEVSVE